MTNGAIQGQAVDPPYPTIMRDPALTSFEALDYQTQVAIDAALAKLEYVPLPEDVRNVVHEGRTYSAVHRAGVWIIYYRDDSQRVLDVWQLSWPPSW